MLARALDVDPGYLMTGVEQLKEELPLKESSEAVPKTIEARILSEGIDKLPKEQRECALAMFRVMFEPQYANLFTKGTEDNDT